MGALLMILGAVAYAGALPLSSSPSSSTSAEVPTGQANGIVLPSPTGFSLPNEDDKVLTRKLEIQQKRKDILYGPSLIGKISFFPSGPLGDQISQRDQSLWVHDFSPVVQSASQEAAAALEDIKRVLDSPVSQIARIFLLTM